MRGDGRGEGSGGACLVSHFLCHSARRALERLCSWCNDVILVCRLLGLRLTKGSRYIAENYWPHELVQVDGLRVMEMYRNAVYLERVEWERGVEEEEVWEPDMSGIADVDGDVEEDMPGLVDEDMWKPKVAEEVWKPVAVGEKAWEPEIGGTDEQDEESGVGGVDSTDDGSWEALVRWIGDKSKGG